MRNIFVCFYLIGVGCVFGMKPAAIESSGNSCKPIAAMPGVDDCANRIKRIVSDTERVFSEKKKEVREQIVIPVFNKSILEVPMPRPAPVDLSRKFLRGPPMGMSRMEVMPQSEEDQQREIFKYEKACLTLERKVSESEKQKIVMLDEISSLKKMLEEANKQVEQERKLRTEAESGIDAQRARASEAERKMYEEEAARITAETEKRRYVSIASETKKRLASEEQERASVENEKQKQVSALTKMEKRFSEEERKRIEAEVEKQRYMAIAADTEQKIKVSDEERRRLERINADMEKQLEAVRKEKYEYMNIIRESMDSKLITVIKNIKQENYVESSADGRICFNGGKTISVPCESFSDFENFIFKR